MIEDLLYEGQLPGAEAPFDYRQREIDEENKKASTTSRTEIKNEKSHPSELIKGSSAQPTDAEVGAVVVEFADSDDENNSREIL